jgi:RNA polymerase sigma-70 factor (ECF subfamily)
MSATLTIANSELLSTLDLSAESELQEEFSPETASTGRSVDLQLATRVAQGDMDAFAALYSQYHERVYYLCLRMMRDGSQAEDLAHDIFLHIHRKIGTFRGDSALATWIYRITVNQVLMYFRRRKRRPLQFLEDLEPGEAMAATSALVSEDKAHERSTRMELEQAIDTLPPGYRLILLLHDVEGCQHEEIAKMVGISIGTSKSQLHKARRRMRGVLRPGTVKK